MSSAEVDHAGTEDEADEDALKAKEAEAYTLSQARRYVIRLLVGRLVMWCCVPK